MSDCRFGVSPVNYPDPDPDAKLSKAQWRVRVAKAVNSYWTEKLIYEAGLYSTLRKMNCTLFIPGKCHPLLINLFGGVHEASRIPVRLRIATGTYMLQCNRSTYKQFETDSTCNLCGDADETLSHFLLECKALYTCRQPIVTDIKSACDSLCGDLVICTLDVEIDRLIIGCSCVLAVYPYNEVSQLQEIQFHSAGLCYALHCLRFKKLGLVTKRRGRQAKNL